MPRRKETRSPWSSKRSPLILAVLGMSRTPSTWRRNCDSGTAFMQAYIIYTCTCTEHIYVMTFIIERKRELEVRVHDMIHSS